MYLLQQHIHLKSCPNIYLIFVHHRTAFKYVVKLIGSIESNPTGSYSGSIPHKVGTFISQCHTLLGPTVAHIPHKGNKE